MLEGEKIYVYKVSEQNITNKTEIKIGIRDGGFIEVIRIKPWREYSCRRIKKSSSKR